MMTENQIETAICHYRLDGIMVGVSINLRPELLEQIDEAKGPQSRSSYIVQAVYEFLNPTKADWEADRKQLIAQVEADKSNERRLVDEVEYLRGEYSKINDALAQRLLTEGPHKKHWWQFRRNKE